MNRLALAALLLSAPAALADLNADFKKNVPGFLAKNALVNEGRTDWKLKNGKNVSEFLGCKSPGDDKKPLMCSPLPLFAKLSPANLFGGQVVTKIKMAASTFESETSAGAFPAYFLPWKANASMTMILGDKADYFFTAAMSGCTFQVAGTAKQPVVTHANAGGLHNDLHGAAQGTAKVTTMNKEHLDPVLGRSPGLKAARLQKWAPLGTEKGVTVFSYDDLASKGFKSAMEQLLKGAKGSQVVVKGGDANELNPEQSTIAVAGVRNPKTGAWTFYEQVWLNAAIETTETKGGKPTGKKNMGGEYLMLSNKQIWPVQ